VRSIFNTGYLKTSKSKMSTFLFNGDWRYEIEIPSFGDFQSGRGVHKSKDNLIKSSGKITLEIEDDLSESPDPVYLKTAYEKKSPSEFEKKCKK